MRLRSARRGAGIPQGSALKKAASKLSEFRKIDPGAVAVRQRDLNKRRRFPVGFFQPTTVLGGSTSNIPAAPQDMFRPERLVIPSDIAFDFGVQDVKGFRRRPAPRDREAMEVLVNLGDVPLPKRSRFLGLFIKPHLDAR